MKHSGTFKNIFSFKKKIKNIFKCSRVTYLTYIAFEAYLFGEDIYWFNSFTATGDSNRLLQTA